MVIIRKDSIQKAHRGGGAFAKGKRAVAIDRRSGFKHLQSEMTYEPGTNYLVHKSESDGAHNLVTDELNFPSEKLRKPEGVGLKYTSPEVSLSIGTVVSPTSLGLIGDIMVNSHYNYPGTSVTTAE